MRHPGLLVALLSFGVAGCSHVELVQPVRTDPAVVQQTGEADWPRTNIDGRPVVSYDSIRTRRDVYLVASNERFADIVSASGRYLPEVEGPCEGLVGAAIKSCVPGGIIRVRQTAVCGCTVTGIYTFADAAGED